MSHERYADMARTRSGLFILASSQVIATVVLVLVLIHEPIFWLPIPFCSVLPIAYLYAIRRQARSNSWNEDQS